ncbi:glycosyltransferase involved in cell wall biosynthesis [Streptomyces olivoverticillatus]|uniref:D-inositol 3-phosphate glycosyltransferase n=1 Tax=Streptomyces olivoverticillatus TaxID=66427 RepID=A0A7W7PJS9_9ACTN|nr:glycosyltransferase [Streptomyces olivoverticillatus]MBB4891723.1 glycosyltransferase involved in cell wall biosynthesis [Streptomyces olivoverticillatus]
MKIEFLLHNAYGIGGTIRSTVNLATALADRHEVRIISVNRPVDEPELAIDPRVTLTPLVDMREGTDGDEYADPLNQQPSEIFRDERIDNGRMAATALTDRRVAAHLAATDADVVIATRPKLIGYLAKYGEGRPFLRLGQEHLTHEAHVAELHAVMDPAISALDAFATVSEADAGHYRDALPDAEARILCIPNAVPAPAAAPSDGTSKTIVSAGRLVGVKRYDRLIAAFAKVAAERPDWNLRIYGRGPAKPKLRKQIEALGLYERITLMGARSPIETEWAKGAVAAVASDAESFGMTIVEAMHAGLPVIATDCPYGPREILTDGTDGILVPLDDADAVDAYADALLRVTGDAALRERLAEAARSAAHRYEPAAIAGRYEELFEELRPGSTAAAPAKKGGLFRGLFGGGRKQQTAAPRPQRNAAHPEARCSVEADGSLTVRIRAEQLTAADTHVLLRHRGSKGKETVRAALPQGGREPGTWVEARIDRAAHEMSEGRWDTYAERSGDKSRRRLTAALVEQKALLGLSLGHTAKGVTAWVPYETTDGFLAVRTWLRPQHAEAAEVRTGKDGVTVTLTAHGFTFGEGAELIARLRGADGSTADVHGLLENGTGFLPYEPMARRINTGEEQDLWDLYARPSSGAALVRVGRIAGDFADRKGVDTFPGAVRGEVRLRPFFTVTNDLTVTVKDVATED